MKKSKKNTIKVLILIAFILLLILAGVFLMIHISRMKNYQNQVSLGDKYLNQMDYENAELCYKKAIEINEKKIVPYIQLSVVYINQNCFEEAEEILNQAAEVMDSKNVEQVTRINEQQGKLKEAKTLYEKQNPNQEELHKIVENTLGYSYIGGKKYDLEFIRKSDYGVKTSLINETGYFCAYLNDFDEDEDKEILVISLQKDEKNDIQYPRLHMLEITENGEWAEADYVDIKESKEEFMHSFNIASVASPIRIDFFLKVIDETPYIFAEGSGYASHFADGENWSLLKYQYTNEGFHSMSGHLELSGSSMESYMRMDPSIEDGSNKEGVLNFIETFDNTGLNAGDRLGYRNHLVYENWDGVYLSSIRKTDIINTSMASEWLNNGISPALGGVKVKFYDYGEPDSLKVENDYMEMIQYIKNDENEIEYYEIVDMGERYGLLTASKEDVERTGAVYNNAEYSDTAKLYAVENQNIKLVAEINGEFPLCYIDGEILSFKNEGVESYFFEEGEQERPLYSESYDNFRNMGHYIRFKEVK